MKKKLRLVLGLPQKDQVFGAPDLEVPGSAFSVHERQKNDANFFQLEVIRRVPLATPLALPMPSFRC
jgi:hypothetical protein